MRSWASGLATKAMPNARSADFFNTISALLPLAKSDGLGGVRDFRHSTVEGATTPSCATSTMPGASSRPQVGVLRRLAE